MGRLEGSRVLYSSASSTGLAKNKSPEAQGRDRRGVEVVKWCREQKSEKREKGRCRWDKLWLTVDFLWCHSGFFSAKPLLERRHSGLRLYPDIIHHPHVALTRFPELHFWSVVDELRTTSLLLHYKTRKAKCWHCKTFWSHMGKYFRIRVGL